MSNKQKKIEQIVYDSIDEISEELKIDVKFYPEVYFIGRERETFLFIGLPETYRKDFYEIRKNKTAGFFPVHNLIITATDNLEHLSEEAGHFIHLNNSKINILKIETENLIDRYSIKIIGESVGYFCSKIVCPERENVYDYKNFRNFIFTSLNKRNLEYKSLDECIIKNNNLTEDFFVYKNGYGLGEKMFNEYISGNIKRKFITNLMKKSFKEEFSATKELLSMLKKFKGCF